MKQQPPYATEPSATDGDVLTTVSGRTQWAQLPSGVQALDDLTDVDTATTPPLNQQSLIWDDVGQQWIPGDPPSQGAIPSGGGIGNALVKLSGADGDIGWGYPAGSYRGEWATSYDNVLGRYDFTDGLVPAGFTPSDTTSIVAYSAPSGGSVTPAPANMMKIVDAASSGTNKVVSTSLGALGLPGGLMCRCWISGNLYSYDRFQFIVGGTVVGEKYGTSGSTAAWSQYTSATIADTTSEVDWKYVNNSNGTAGQNAGFVAIVEFFETVTAAYRINDVVSHNGKLWVCQAANTTQEPGAGADWMRQLGQPDLNTVAIKTVAANYTTTTADAVIVANGSAVTVTLLDPTTCPGRTLRVKNINAAAVTVNSAGASKTIDGATSASLTQWAAGRYISDGTQWLAI